jgi:iron-sulfur cluster assembly protein
MTNETAVITLTSEATDKLKNLIEEEGQTGSALRVLIVPSGEGFQYMLSLEDAPKDDDLVVEQDGVTVLVDEESAPLMEGTLIDYVDNLMRSGFVISNPNLQMGGGGGCGCGGNCACGGGGQ